VKRARLTNRAALDERLFGSSAMGGQAFNLTVALFEALMKECVEVFPDEVRSEEHNVSFLLWC